MDNIKQIKEILKYKKHLTRILHRVVSFDEAASIWIHKFAALWRKKHLK